MAEKLELRDIADLRAYENERATLRPRMIELKSRRRVAVGPFVSVTFENRETVRYQVQEMARAERMLRDQQIQDELDTYNPLIPGPQQFTATLFIELTSKEDLIEWLPKLVGIERAVELQIGNSIARATPEESHDAQLTREEVTASVHYLKFQLTDEQAAQFGTAPVRLRITLPAYEQSTALSQENLDSLREDLQHC